MITTFQQFLKENKNIENNLNDNFLKWFDGSKVVDDKGKPLVVYHGSKNDIKIFDLNKIGSGGSDGILQSGNGIYFTNSIEQSKGYGTFIKSVFLSIKNPIYKNEAVPQKLINFCLKTYPKLNNLDDVEFKYKIGSVHRILQFLQNANRDTSKVLMSLGYDGIVDNGIIKDYIVFNPNQIKSIENDGTWNKGDDNIYS